MNRGLVDPEVVGDDVHVMSPKYEQRDGDHADSSTNRTQRRIGAAASTAPPLCRLPVRG